MQTNEADNDPFNPSLAEHDMPDTKPTDLDLHCLSLNMWISIKNLDQVIWLAGN